jgi:hypothetical protein
MPKPVLPAKRKPPRPSKADGVQAPAPPKLPPTNRPAIPESVRTEISERLQKLAGMNVSQLRAEYQRVFGQPAKSSHRQHLIRKIAWEIQAQVEGRLPEEIRQYAFRIAEQTDLFRRVQESLKQRAVGNAPQSTAAPKRARRAPRSQTKQRDPRIPPAGSLLIVKHGRQTLRVAVLEVGFEYAGLTFQSLTAVARRITGKSVNAYEFFGLGAPTEGGGGP